MSLNSLVRRMVETANTPAQPLPLYVERRLLRPEALHDWLKEQGYPETAMDDPKTWHVTICYSTNPVLWEQFQPKTEWYTERNGFADAEQFGEANVLLLPEHTFEADHQRFRAGGASWDFPSYRPHVTVGKGVDAARWKSLPVYQGELLFGSELFNIIRD